ncbi:Integration host factor subunit beta [Serratia symbiotica]|nr:Integration host factor subunit beta [Serratia symbiotica]
MTKSELIKKLAIQKSHIPIKIIENTVKKILEHMITILSNNERIEIRRFGSFTLHYHIPHIGRNPKTGNQIDLSGKYVPHFKPGKSLRNRINKYN